MADMDYILEMRNITKLFPGVRALDNVNFQVRRGEIHALTGENGAGKSTLMKILSGFYGKETYEGELILNGQVCNFKNIQESEKKGIAIIYQESSLAKHLNICENIFLGNEIKKFGVINWEKSHAIAKDLLKRVMLDADTETKLSELGIGQQQLVEIAKALSKNVDILILDEPTAALTEQESANLLNLLRQLREKGVTCIYISHKLNEVLDIADRVTVIRDGKTIITKDAKDLTQDELIRYMVGRELTNQYPERERRVSDEVVLQVKNWCVDIEGEYDTKHIADVSFDLRKGEVLGIAGLMGAGRTELVMSIFGAYGDIARGELRLDGRQIINHSPADAIRNGISCVSEDRKRLGLILSKDIKTNITLPSLKAISKMSVINENEEIVRSEKLANELGVKTPSIEQRAGNLSGGNQQKVVLAKWLMTNPKVLIMDEPTRGIDVGAKYEIYQLMNRLIEQGMSIIMVSSELPEILGMSDRVMVMHEGRMTAILDINEANQEEILSYATGVRQS